LSLNKIDKTLNLVKLKAIIYYFNLIIMKKIIEKKAYRFLNFTTEYESCRSNEADCTVLYIHGLGSTPWSRKADNIKSTALQLGLNFYRCELIGHGSDQNNFANCDFELWKQQLTDIINHHIGGDIIIVGHCVGGWLGMCLTERYPDRIKAFLSLAACPDLIEQKLRNATVEQRRMLAETGTVEANIEKYHYTLSKHLWTSLDANNLLQKPSLNINCPLHLIQGKQDNFIDWKVVLRILEKAAYPKTVVKILKNSNHHLQDPIDLRETSRSLSDLYAAIKVH